MPTKFHPVNFYQYLHNVFSGNLPTGGTTLNSATTPKISIYSGAQPIGVDAVDTSAGAVLLAIIKPTTGAFSPASGGVARLLTTLQANASASGTAAWARITGVNNSVAKDLIDTPVSLTGGGGGAILDSLSITSGNPVKLEALAFFMPETLGTLSLSLSLRNALINAFVVGDYTSVSIGENSTLSIYTGAAPASIYDAPTGTKLADFISASSNIEMWFSAAVSGEATLSNESGWNVATTVAAGSPGYFRLVKGSLVMQGTCGTTGTDITVDKASVTSSESLTITEGTLLAA